MPIVDPTALVPIDYLAEYAGELYETGEVGAEPEPEWHFGSAIVEPGPPSWAHAAGELAIWLQQTIKRVSLDAAALGKDVLVKFVAAGSTLAETAAASVGVLGREFWPYSPCQLSGSRASGDLTVTWVRRTRYQQGWADGSDVPLGEASEAYELDVRNDADTLTLRTISAAAQTALYTAAQQTTDFGAPKSSIRARLYQISAKTGRGYVTKGTL